MQRVLFLCSLALAGAMLLLLAGCGSNGQNTVSALLTKSLTACPLADAVECNQPYGANLVRWPAQANQVIAYLIYRDSNPYAPIAVVDGSTTSYIDSALPLPAPIYQLESNAMTTQIDPRTGSVTQFNNNTTYDGTLDNLGTPVMTISPTIFSITSRFVPLLPGQTCGYQLSTLYLKMTSAGYALQLTPKSAVSARVTLTMPPALNLPSNNMLPIDGTFTCSTVPGATCYLLQVSADPRFVPSATFSEPTTSLNGATATAFYDLSTLVNTFAGAKPTTIYWRMGAQGDSSILPSTVSDPNDNGWVFSLPYSFVLPSSQQPPLFSQRKK